MSYDLYLFKLADGLTVEEVNNFLASDEYQEFLDSDEDEDADADDDKPVLPDPLVDTSLDEDTLRTLAGKAYLRVTVPEDERSEELTEYLESDDGDAAVPEEWEDDVQCMFEYSGSAGILPVMFSYGGDLDEAMDLMAGILDELGEGFAIFDPQIGKAVDSANSRAQLGASAVDASAKFDEIRKKLEAGELELFSAEDLKEIENEDDEDPDEDDEEEHEKKKDER